MSVKNNKLVWIIIFYFVLKIKYKIFYIFFIFLHQFHYISCFIINLKLEKSLSLGIFLKF